MSDGVYMLREYAHGTYYPKRYQHHNTGGGRSIHGWYETVYIGTHALVRERIAAGTLPDLPWLPR